MFESIKITTSRAIFILLKIRTDINSIRGCNHRNMAFLAFFYVLNITYQNTIFNLWIMLVT